MTVRTGLLGQNCQARTAETGLLGQNCQARTAETGLVGQDRQDKTLGAARTGLTAWIAGTGHPGLDNLGTTARRGRAERDRQHGTDRTRQAEHYR
jgi:hypothetical protein